MQTPPRGFSFTTMFFGPIPVLLRGDTALAGWVLLPFLLSFIPVLGVLMLPFFFLIPAMVNRVYEERLTDKGAKFFPLGEGEAKNAIIYFVVWLAVILLSFAAVGFTAAMAL